MYKRKKAIINIGAALAVFLVSVSWAHALTVGAAAGYKRMLQKALGVYEQKTGRKIEQVYGHMGQVVMQAKVGGSMGVIIGELSFLEGSGLALADFRDLGRGILVLAYRKNASLHSPEELRNPAIRKIATPDPRQAIYGKAAVEFLKNSGLFEKLHDKILTIATIPQVSSYLISGDVDAGFINKTDALFIREKIGGWVEIDKTLYSPIQLTMGVIKGYESDPDVKRFLEFMTTDSDAARMMIDAGIR